MAKKTNFEVNGTKYFRVTRTVGHKTDGTPIRKTFYGTGINEANQKADKYMNKIKSGFSSEFEKTTVEAYLKKWLFSVKRIKVKPAAFVTYESNYRLYIKNSKLGILYMKDVKKIHIQEFYNDLFEKGKSTEKIKAIHKLLHSFFEYAVDEGYLLKNPCHKVVIPKNTIVKNENKKIDCFSVDEINDIKEAFKRK